MMQNLYYRNNKIIIFGGTFDPIHFGHLILAQSALEYVKADKVKFIPCYMPPHKIGFKLTNWKHRLNMVKLAIKNNPSFELEDYEIRKRGISYSYLTVDFFSKKYKNNIIYFLIGYDSLIEITTWQKWEQIVDKVYFLVGNRSVGKLNNNTEIHEKILKKTIFYSSPTIEISSTEVRKRIRNNLFIEYYIPISVANYIKKHRLYI
ncbi:MAG: nicotinate (nicotinamide) nucleotide adenylyltransferase [Endomicrobia bacterium]|nr:nicotinate (nicotinamide) nucleotide adenylyltransferase [Endomicrobiia bacterium]